MNFKQRCDLARQGKYVLRSQLSHTGHYNIVYQTVKGGWAIYNRDNWLDSTKEFCDEKIKELVKQDPELFFIDEDLI